jgi:hypothetical protein
MRQYLKEISIYITYLSSPSYLIAFLTFTDFNILLLLLLLLLLLTYLLLLDYKTL